MAPATSERIELFKKARSVLQSLNKETSLTVMVPGSRLYVEKVCDTFEEGIDLCVDSMKVQLVKFKEKLRNN